MLKSVQLTLMMGPIIAAPVPSVVLESLAYGVPVLCTDLGGPGIMVNPTCGRSIATAGRNPEQLTCDLSSALLEIVTVPNMLESLSYGAKVRAR